MPRSWGSTCRGYPMHFELSSLQVNPATIDFGALAEEATPRPRFSGEGRGRATILRSLSGVATKTIYPDKEEDYRLGKWFTHETRALDSIFDLYDLLTGMERDPTAFLIRGEVPPDAPARIMRRSLGEGAVIRPVTGGGYWVCVDADSIPVDISGDPLDVVTRWIDTIPQLRDTTCIYQLSARYRIKPGLRVHLWYWLEEPRQEAQIIEWLMSLPFKADPSVLKIVQPNYTAAPLFRGVADPLAGAPRYGLIRRENDSLFIPSGDVEGEIAHWEEKIAALGETGDPRHPVVNRAAYALGGWVGGGVADESEVIERLVSACAMSGAFDEGRLTTIRDEIVRALADGAKHPRQVSTWKHGLRMSEKGVILPTIANMAHIFAHHPGVKGSFAYNVREQSVEIIKRLPWDPDGMTYPRPCRDSDDVHAVVWLDKIGLISSGIDKVNNVISTAAAATHTDVVATYLDGLTWDGVPRLDQWVSKSMGVSDNIYHRAAGRKFLISMVARTYEPGCKADHMLILCGPQGSLKSSLLATLVGGVRGGFADSVGDITSPKDFVPNLMGPWLLEIPELSAFSKKEVENIKQFLTAQRDRHRLSYGRRAVEVPRRCVFAGTTNDPTPLQDTTGNRRFWPIDVVSIDLNWVAENRDSLFAEAVVTYRSGERWYLEGPAAAAAIAAQADHTTQDPWEDLIAHYLSGFGVRESINFAELETRIRNEVTISELLAGAIGRPESAQHTGDCRRVGAIMTRFGWKRQRARRNHVPVWIWTRPKEV